MTGEWVVTLITLAVGAASVLHAFRTHETWVADPDETETP